MATIPVDLRNPGQVFACLGLMEVAEILCGDARAGFDWTANPATFTLAVDNCQSPIETVLDFISKAVASELAPIAWAEENDDEWAEPCLFSSEFPESKGANLSLPVVLTGPDEISLPGFLR